MGFILGYVAAMLATMGGYTQTYIWGFLGLYVVLYAICKAHLDGKKK